MRTLRWIGSALVPLCLMGTGACEDPDTRPANWEVIHTSIIAPSCATSSCHNDLAKTAGFSLEDIDDAYDFLIEGFLVEPGNEQSFLMLRLEGELDGLYLMPPDGPLPAADIELIRQWIADGANR